MRSMAETLVGEAAAFVRRRRAEVFGAQTADSVHGLVQTKSSPTDPVTVVDTETERFIRDRLARLRPGDAVLGEEGGGSGDVSGRDPVRSPGSSTRSTALSTSCTAYRPTRSRWRRRSAACQW